MELKEKIQKLDLKPRNAPEGISPDKFGRWIRTVKAGGKINAIARTLLNLYCDSLLSSRITGEPCYKSKEDEKNSLVNAVLDAQKRIQTVERSTRAPKPIKETPLKISKKKEKTKIIAVKSTSNVWLEEGYTRESGVNTFFKINDELWKVPSTGLKGVVVFGDEERDVDSFKKYQ